MLRVRREAHLGPDLPASPATLLEQEPLRRLAPEGQPVAYEHQGYGQPMDTLREHTLLNDLWSSGRAPWESWDDPTG